MADSSETFALSPLDQYLNDLQQNGAFTIYDDLQTEFVKFKETSVDEKPKEVKVPNTDRRYLSYHIQVFNQIKCKMKEDIINFCKEYDATIKNAKLYEDDEDNYFDNMNEIS